MDESLKRMEDRLEALVPKGISDHGRERMEEMIDGLAAGVVGERSDGGTWKWAVGTAACLGLAAGLAFLVGPDAPESLGELLPREVVKVAMVERASYAPGVETMASSRQVDGRFDEGWVIMDGAGMPHRYWAYELTDEEEVVDEESGYTVRIYSQREEWVPVKLTSL